MNNFPYSGNVATLPSEDVNNAKNLAGDKEETASYRVIALTERDGKPEMVEAITVRCWMGRSSSASVVYASVWVRTADREHWFSGHGKAGGYGYHKESAAIDDAIRSAGITLDKSFSGCGESPMRVALHAIAQAAGYDYVEIF